MKAGLAVTVAPHHLAGRRGDREGLTFAVESWKLGACVRRRLAGSRPAAAAML